MKGETIQPVPRDLIVKGQVIVALHRANEAMKAAPGSDQHVRKVVDLTELLSNTPGAVDQLLSIAGNNSKQ